MRRASSSRIDCRFSAAACRRAAALATLSVLAVIPLAARTAAQRPPVEERVTQAWRWRELASPDRDRPSFRAVRPWGESGLIAVDDGGLAWFDGYSWQHQAGWKKPMLGEVYDIIPVADGVFVICDGNVISIDESGELHQIAALPRPVRLKPAWRQPDGTALVAVGPRILELASAKSATAREVRTAPAGAETIHCVVIDGAGAMWAVTDTGLFRDTGGGWQSMMQTDTDRSRAQQFVRAIVVKQGVCFFRESPDANTPPYIWNGRELLPLPVELTPGGVADAATCSQGTLLLAMGMPELHILRDGQVYDAKPALTTSDSLRSVCVLPKGRLAVVTETGQLWQADLETSRWETHDPGVSAANRQVNALAPSRRGGLWLGTHGGIVRYADGRFSDYHDLAGETGITLRGITAIGEDPEGRVWVGSGATFRGALCLDGDRWSYNSGPSDVEPRYVHSIIRIGSELWFAELDDGVGPFQQGAFERLKDGVFTQFPRSAEGKALNRSYDVALDSSGRLLAGTADNLYAFEDETWRALGLPELTGARAFALQPTHDGTLWIGLGLEHTGVLQWRDGITTRLDQRDWDRAAAADFCETGDGRLWFTSESGLFLAMDGECHEVSGGLPSRNFWPILDDGEGGLWLGSRGSGLVHFRPDDHEAPRTFPIEMRYDEDGCPIAHWDAADRWHTTPASELRFRLTLDGFPLATGATWSGVRQAHEAALGELSPGSHTVTVVSVDAVGNVESEPQVKSFPVAPPNWRSAPMLVAYGAVALALAGVMIVLLNRRRERLLAQRRQAELAERLSVLTRRLFSSAEDERRRISRELHDDLGQSLTAIGFDLQIAERKGTTPEGRVATERALTTVRGALDRVRAISSMLRPAVLDDLGLEQAVRTVLSEFTTRTGVDGQLEIELEGARIPDAVAGHVYRILQEALTNVARHASASTVFVNLRATGELIELTVKDDGAGFTTSDVPTSKRFGLLGMRERSELMGGSFRLESAPGTGTTIHVSIPLKTAPEPT